MATPSGKRYGLILPSKKNISKISKPAAFGDSSSDEEVSKGTPSSRCWMRARLSPLPFPGLRMDVVK